MVCIYCKKHLVVSVECPLCKAFPINTYILSARQNEEPISTEYNIVSKLHKNTTAVDRVYEVFELFHVNTVHHINDYLYCKNRNSGMEIVNKMLQFQNTTIREITTHCAPVMEKKTEDNQRKLLDKIKKLSYKHKKLEVKMLKYKLKYKCLKSKIKSQ